MTNKYVGLEQYKRSIDSIKEYIDKSIPHIKTQELITIPADTVLEIFYSDNHMMEFDKPSNINLDYDFIVNYNNEEIDCTTGENETGKYIECFNDNTILLKFYPGVGINGNANETKMVLAIELLNTDIIVTDIVLKQVKAKYLNNKYLKRDVAIKNSITIGTRLFGNSIGRYSFSNGAYNIASGDNSHAEGHRSKALYLFSHAEGNNTTASGESSHAEGNNSKASGESSHAEGSNTTASGNKSHAEGNGTRASAFSSHAEGNSTKASGYCSHAEGYTTTAEGQYSHAEGSDTTVSGSYSHAEGYNSKVSGDCSHVEGNSTTASGNSSHAEGYYTIAKGQNQHVQGKYNIEDTANKYAHIVGNGSAYNIRSNAHTLDWSGNAWYAGDVQANNVPHVISEDVIITIPAASIVKADYEDAMSNDESYYIPITGEVPTINSEDLYAMRYNNAEYEANVYYDDETLITSLRVEEPNCAMSFVLSDANAPVNESVDDGGKDRIVSKPQIPYCAIDKLNVDNITDIEVKCTKIQKLNNKFLEFDLKIKNSISMNRTGVIGELSTALGEEVEASGNYSHAEGEYTTASGYSSHAEGYNTTASYEGSHAEGMFTTASGMSSHAEGSYTKSSGNCSHAEGYDNTASGDFSHTEGYCTTASGIHSHAEGNYTKASSSDQHVQGKFNVEDTANKYAHIVGNGAKDATTNWQEIRSNAHTLDWEGNAWYKGSVYTGGTGQDDTNAKKLATEDYVDSSLPDASKYINERFVEKDIDANSPEYQTTTSNGNIQLFYNFDISNKHSNNMAVICELTMNNTNDKYTTDIALLNDYEVNRSYISLPVMHILDNTTNKEIAMCYVGLRGSKTVDTEGNIVTTTQLYDSAFIQFARSTTHISNDINNVFSNGFKLKVIFYDISDKYVGDVYHIPYNLKNGSESTIYQETCEAKDNVTNATVLGYKSVSTMGNSINIGYRCTANGTGIIVGADSTINANPSYLFGTGSTINRGYGMAVGIGLNIPAASSNKGSMILGVGGTLATDSSFAISTAKVGKNSSDCSDIRYPFEVKTNNDVYLRGSNLILETDNEPSQDNHLVNKKYVDDSTIEATDDEVDAMLLEVLGGDYSVQS